MLKEPGFYSPGSLTPLALPSFRELLIGNRAERPKATSSKSSTCEFTAKRENFANVPRDLLSVDDG